MPEEKRSVVRYCGRVFEEGELAFIRSLIADDSKPNRARLSRLVCERLNWRKPDGKLKDMSCRVAMLRMHRDGLLKLPLPEKPNCNGRIRPLATTKTDPEPPMLGSVGELGNLNWTLVGKKESSLWNELIERYHYLGYQPLPGAQLRYLVYAEHRLVAVLGFSAAAWKCAPRDQFIGWTPDARKANLNLVVNNSRFLIPPWVQCRNLASSILSQAVRLIPRHWHEIYRYSPVLMETFVEKQRFSGICYKAANWVYVGESKGRGKLDSTHSASLPEKLIFLYPMNSRFRSILQKI